MKQKVFVQGRERQPVHLKRGYTPAKDEDNNFSEIDSSQMNISCKTRQHGFRVRQQGTWKSSSGKNTWERKKK